ncbi:MAG: DoxX family protein [Acidobacteria bacterium]|nr:DoxX family protein [Acidobacteriota bacterium]
MAFDRQRTGLTILRICIGVFFVFEGLGKIGWFTNSSLLADQLSGWSRAAAAGSMSQWYLQRIAVPGLAFFARLVPLGEMSSGVAMIVGFWTPLAAFIAFFMALNFQIASGAVFKYSFLTSPYGLPVLGSTLALALAGSRRKSKNLKLKSQK